jgi:hypothetical protein
MFVLTGNSGIFYTYGASYFTDAMKAEHPGAQVISVSTSLGSSTRAGLIAQAKGFDKVLIVSMEWKPVLQSSDQRTLINEMLAENVPLAYVCFGSPFQWNALPQLENFLCGFSCHYATQQQMAKVVTGEVAAGHNWPVQLGQVPSAVTDWNLYQ